MDKQPIFHKLSFCSWQHLQAVTTITINKKTFIANVKFFQLLTRAADCKDCKLKLTPLESKENPVTLQKLDCTLTYSKTLSDVSSHQLLNKQPSYFHTLNHNDSKFRHSKFLFSTTFIEGFTTFEKYSSKTWYLTMKIWNLNKGTYCIKPQHIFL